jgi:hypothetical protein
MSVVVLDYGAMAQTSGNYLCFDGCAYYDDPVNFLYAPGIQSGFYHFEASSFGNSGYKGTRPGDRIIIAYFANAFASGYTVSGSLTSFSLLYSDGNTPGWRWWISNLDNTPGGAPTGENAITITNASASYAYMCSWAIRGCNSSPFESYTQTTVTVDGNASITTTNNSSCILGVCYPSSKNNSDSNGAVLSSAWPSVKKPDFPSGGSPPDQCIDAMGDYPGGRGHPRASMFCIPNMGNAKTSSGVITNQNTTLNVDYMILSAKPTQILTIVY